MQNFQSPTQSVLPTAAEKYLYIPVTTFSYKISPWLQRMYQKEYGCYGNQTAVMWTELSLFQSKSDTKIWTTEFDQLDSPSVLQTFH